MMNGQKKLSCLLAAFLLAGLTTVSAETATDKCNFQMEMIWKNWN